ncbi:MAG: hypothetical protein ACOX3G_07240 [Armatimonadota bacterium]|jgi:hypothetical protein
MLLTIVEVVCCENPKCRDFGRVAPNPHRLRSYYCPICSKISSVRVVDVNVAESVERFRDYLLQRVETTDDFTAKPTSSELCS